MEKLSKNIVEFMAYIGKVLVPVLLGSLIFSGILAKYNNEMNLNKAILESAYRPMKQQYRECIVAQQGFLRQLGGYTAAIESLRVSVVKKRIKPPRAFWEHVHQSADNNIFSPGELEKTWNNLMLSYGAFTSLLGDLSLMLGKDRADLNAIIAKRQKNKETYHQRKRVIFKDLFRIELEGLFVEIEKSTAEEMKKNKGGWEDRLEIARNALQALDKLASDARKAQNDDFDKSNASAFRALKKRFETGPFDLFTGS